MTLLSKPLLSAESAHTVASKRTQTLRVLLHQNTSGHMLTETLCDLLDEHMRMLFRALTERFGPLPFSIYATGSYGRRQLCPRSDLDLLVLYPANFEDRKTLALWISLIRAALHAEGWTTSCPARTPEECAKLALDDLTIASSMLDARSLLSPAPHPTLPHWAHRHLASHIAATLRNTLGGPHFARSLFEVYTTRHQNTQRAMYTLEPDIKRDRGGLRDLQFLGWSAHILHDLTSLTGDFSLPATQAQEHHALHNAADTLLRIRFALHLQDTPLALNKLLYAYQTPLAELFQYTTDTPTLLLPERSTHDTHTRTPAERFLRDLHRCMHTIASIATRWQRLWLLPQHDATHPISIRRGLCVRQGHLDLTRAQDQLHLFDDASPVRTNHARSRDDLFSSLEGTPAMALHTQAEELLTRNPIEIFETSLDLNLPIHPATYAHIARAPRAEPPPREALSSLRRLLTSASCPFDIIADLHTTRLLENILPELRPIHALVTHDVYHIYTVDAHLLHVHDILKSLLTPSLHAESTYLEKLAASIPDHRRPVLLLAGLLHDIGKGYAGDHHETSSIHALSIGSRLGLTQRELDNLESLVQHHFLLTSISQRRDLDDPDTLLSVARTLRSQPTLDDLTLLSIADMSAAAPNNFTPWKAKLLQNLHERVSDVFQRGLEDIWWGEPLRARIAQLLFTDLNKPRRLSRAFCETFAHTTARHYVQTTHFDTLKHHAALIADAPATHLSLVHWEHDPSHYVARLLIACPSFYGLLASVTGVLTSHGINILNAMVQTTTQGFALDIFTIEAPNPLPPLRLRALERELKNALFGDLDVQARVLKARSAQLPPKGPETLTHISIDQDLSRTWTILDVITRDRLGVLWTITQTLRTLECDVHLSKIATEGLRVVDVFYIQHRVHKRKLSDHEAETLIATLQHTLSLI